MCCASVVLLKYREQIVVTFFVYIEYTVMAIRPVHGTCEKLAHNFYSIFVYVVPCVLLDWLSVGLCGSVKNLQIQLGR